MIEDAAKYCQYNRLKKTEVTPGIALVYTRWLKIGLNIGVKALIERERLLKFFNQFPTNWNTTFKQYQKRSLLTAEKMTGSKEEQKIVLHIIRRIDYKTAKKLEGLIVQKIWHTQLKIENALNCLAFTPKQTMTI